MTNTNYNHETATKQLVKFLEDNNLTLAQIRKIAPTKAACATFVDVFGNKLTLTKKENAFKATLVVKNENKQLTKVAKKIVKALNTQQEQVEYVGFENLNTHTNKTAQTQAAHATEQFVKWFGKYTEKVEEITGNVVVVASGKERALRVKGYGVKANGELERHVARITKDKRNKYFMRTLDNLRKLDEKTQAGLVETFKNTKHGHVVKFMFERLLTK